MIKCQKNKFKFIRSVHNFFLQFKPITRVNITVKPNHWLNHMLQYDCQGRLASTRGLTGFSSRFAGGGKDSSFLSSSKDGDDHEPSLLPPFVFGTPAFSLSCWRLSRIFLFLSILETRASTGSTAKKLIPHNILAVKDITISLLDDAQKAFEAFTFCSLTFVNCKNNKIYKLKLQLINWIMKCFFYSFMLKYYFSAQAYLYKTKLC